MWMTGCIFSLCVLLSKRLSFWFLYLSVTAEKFYIYKKPLVFTRTWEKLISSLPIPAFLREVLWRLINLLWPEKIYLRVTRKPKHEVFSSPTWKQCEIETTVNDPCSNILRKGYVATCALSRTILSRSFVLRLDRIMFVHHLWCSTFLLRNFVLR